MNSSKSSQKLSQLLFFAINIAATCSTYFYTVRYKEKCLVGCGRNGLPKLVDNRVKTCFLGKRHSLEATCSFLSFISRYPATRRHRTVWYKIHLNRTWTGISSIWCHQYTYVHAWTRSPWNSVAIKRMHKQCVPGALPPPPPVHLGTRLNACMCREGSMHACVGKVQCMHV